MTDDFMKYVETLIKRAAEMEGAQNAPAAVNFSQAACNAANALRVLEDVKNMRTK